MKQSIFIIIARISSVLAALISSYILIRSIDIMEGDWSDLLFLALNLLWIILPYVILFFMISIKSVFRLDVIFTIIVCAFSAISVFVLIDGMFIHPDAQGGLIFLFLPFYQILAAVFLLGAKFMLRKRTRNTK